MESLFAYALTNRMTPQVFEFSNDMDGLRSLANLVRSEDVLAVVQGSKIRFEVASVVSFNSSGMQLEDRMPIEPSGGSR
jgi:hypothetical protein